MATTNASAQNPDALAGEHVAEELHPLLQFLVENLKPIVMGIAAVLLVVGGVSLYNMYAAKQAAKAADELGVIIISRNGSEKLDALAKFAADAPEGVKKSALFALADAAMQEGDYDKAKGAYELLSAMGGDLVLIGTLGESSALLKGGQPAKALKKLTALKKTAPESLETYITLQVAAAAEAAGDTQAALAAYEELAGNDAATDKGYLEYKISRLKGE